MASAYRLATLARLRDALPALQRCCDDARRLLEGAVTMCPAGAAGMHPAMAPGRPARSGQFTEVAITVTITMS